MVWSLSPATPAALALVGVVELVAGLIDIVAPKRIVSGLSPAEAAVLPLIGAMRLALAAFMLIVVFLRTGPLALELIATAVVAYECVAQPLGLARSGGRFRSRMWMAVTLGAVTLVAMWRDDMASGQSAGATLLGSPRLVAANLFCLFGLIACLVSPASAAKVGLGEVRSPPYFSMDEHHKLSPVAKRLLT